MNFFEKLSVVRSVLQNWYLLPIDRLGLAVVVTYRSNNGLVFRCRSRSTDVNEFTAILAGLSYPLNLLKQLPEGAMVVDLGANVGAFTVVAAQLNRGNSLNFLLVEPFTGNLTMLRQNLHANGVRNASILEGVVSTQDGDIMIDTTRSFAGIKVDEAAGNERVKSFSVATLLEKVQKKPVDFMKMDIEGAEYNILEQDAERLAKSVKRIVVEYHETEGDGLDRIGKAVAGHFVVKSLTLKKGQEGGALLLDSLYC